MNVGRADRPHAASTGRARIRPLTSPPRREDGARRNLPARSWPLAFAAASATTAAGPSLAVNFAAYELQPLRSAVAARLHDEAPAAGESLVTSLSWSAVSRCYERSRAVLVRARTDHIDLDLARRTHLGVGARPRTCAPSYDTARALATSSRSRRVGDFEGTLLAVLALPYRPPSSAPHRGRAVEGAA